MQCWHENPTCGDRKSSTEVSSAGALLANAHEATSVVRTHVNGHAKCPRPLEEMLEFSIAIVQVLFYPRSHRRALLYVFVWASSPLVFALVCKCVMRWRWVQR